MSRHKIEVFTRPDPNGQPLPERFIWSGVAYQVEDIGRQWDARDGHHLLVMANGSHVYELIYASTNQTWYLKPPHNPRLA
jgi:hypothetical protein